MGIVSVSIPRVAIVRAMTLSVQRLREMIREDLPDLVAFRRDLHAHPELQYEEVRTSQRVRDELQRHEIEFVGGLAGGTGVLALLSGSDAARTVALRADMDALPITEETGAAHASQNEGVMHACGHDGHTTVCLGAARVLKKIADTDGLPRPVKLLFQPAEEGGAGGERMVQDGCLTDRVLGPAVSEMYGLHGWPELDLGSVTTRPGVLMAATDAFTICVRGKMTHAAKPHLGRDPIVAGAQIVAALQTIASRDLDPAEPVVVTVARFHAGSAFNVIPETAVLEGTVRTLSDEARAHVQQRLSEIAGGAAAALGCSVEVDWRPGYPVTSNDAGAVDRFFEVARATAGAERATVFPHPSMTAEDFSFYGREVPACFFFLGQRRSPGEEFPGLHTPRYDFNDDSLALGIELFCRLALELA